MPELLLTSSGGSAYAVRSDRVERVVDISSISRPMRAQRPDLIAVVVDERVLYFSDLAVRLGEGGALASRGAGLLIRGGDSIAGVAVGPTPRTVVVPDEDLVPVAESVGDALIDSCARIDGGLVPVLSDAFFDTLSNETPPQWSFDRGVTRAGLDVYAESLVEIQISGRRVALRGAGAAVAPPEAHETIRLPGAPAHLTGLAAFGGAMHPVIDLARLLDFGTASPDAVTLVWTSGDRVLLVIADALSAPLPDDVPVAELPPVLRRGAIRRAALSGDSVLPIVDPRDALDASDASSETDPAPTYRLASDFSDRFLTSEVTVHEFALGGSVYAIPEHELAELDTSHEAMVATADGALICGAIRADDRIVPVLDLHAYLGFRIDDASTEGGLLVQNGDFEGAFFPHRSLGTRTLDPSVQRPLPLAPARPLVYGCYVDGSDVRLILNVAMIAQFARDPATQAALAELAPPATETAERAVGATGVSHEPDEAPALAGETPAAEASDDTSTADGGRAPTAPSEPGGGAPPSVVSSTQTPHESSPSQEPSISAPSSQELSTQAVSPSDAPPNEPSTAGVPLQESPPGSPSGGARPSASPPETSETSGSPSRSRRPLAIILLLLLLATVVVAGIMVVPEMIDRAENAGASRESLEGGDRPTSRQPRESPPAPAESGVEESALPRRASLRVSFDADSADLLPPARAALDRLIAEVSDRTVVELTVVGHAARFGSAASSQALSEARARVTAEYLARRLKVAPESVVVRGAGARQPIADNETEEGRSANRRVEVEAVIE